MQWLKHAFAIESPTDAEPTPAEAALVERVCREVVRRRLTTPALLLLEMSRPLNYVGSQTLRFFEPLLGAFVGTDGPATFATFLERRGSIEVLCRRIEELEAEAERVENENP